MTQLSGRSLPLMCRTALYAGTVGRGWSVSKAPCTVHIAGLKPRWPVTENTPNLRGSYQDIQYTDWPTWRIDEELYDIPVPGETIYLLTRCPIPYRGTTVNPIQLS